MTLSTSTDETRTIKKTVELTAVTSLQDLTGPIDGPQHSVSTEPPMFEVDPTFECSTVKTCAGIRYFDLVDHRPTTFGVWDRFSFAEPYGIAKKRIGNYPERYSEETQLSNSIIAYISGSLLRESADQIFTNGTTCTLVRHRVFNCFHDARLYKDIKAANVLFLNYDPAAAPVCSALTSTALNVEEFFQNQLRRRERLKAAYRAGMQALQRAEEAYVQAVNEESKLGIDWDEWEDPPVDL